MDRTKQILGPEFFERSTLQVARELLGKYLVRRRGGKTRAFLITEVEAYAGRGDMSSHAANGITKRNKAVFGPPAHWYVYLIYGMYHCLNIVTESHGTPAAVLIRGVAVVKNGESRIRRKVISGPGKICRELGITTALYGKLAARSSGLWVEQRSDKGLAYAKATAGRPETSYKIRKTPRINVGGDEKAKKRLWRFVLVSSKSRITA